MAVYNETSQGGLRCSGSAVVPPVFWIGDSTDPELQAYEKFLQEWNNVEAAPSSGTASIFKALATYGEDGTGGVEVGGESIDDFIYTAKGGAEVGGAITLDDGARQLSLASNQYFLAPNGPSLQTGDVDFWMSAWFYLDSTSSYKAIIAKDDISGGGATREYQLDVESSGAGGEVRFAVSSDGTSLTGSIQTTEVPVDGQWYFVLAWHDSTNNTLNVRLNDNPVNSTGYSGGVTPVFTPFTIGRRYNDNSRFDGRLARLAFGKPGSSIDGYIEDIHERLYNNNLGLLYEDLTTDEKSDWGLVSYWNGNENSGDLHDSHGSNHAENINGATTNLFDTSALYYEDSTGGVEVGGIGDIPETFNDIASGGGEIGGQASFVYDEDGDGGVEVGGDFVVAIGYDAQGGAEVGGESTDSLINISTGGAEVGGAALDSIVVEESGSGGVVVGATSRNNLAINKYYNVTDPSKRRILVGGEASTRLDIKYIASGGVTLQSDSDINFRFATDLTLRWRLNALIVKDTTFLWNTGELPIVWYRVVGKQSEKCEPLQNCCQKMITNIHARTPAELCEKLRERRFQFKIDSVQKFTRPAENDNVILDEDCNELVPVEICEVPACAEFCVDFEPQVFLGLQVTVQVDAFFTYESTGQIYVGGSAGIDYERYIPDFPYEANGGLTLGGTVDYISSGYGPVVDGGISIGGTAKQKSSHWSYIGGEWPLLTGDLAPTTSESLEELITDVPWGAVDRVLNDDLLPTQTDLSFGKSSEYLIVRGFDINLPENAEIRGLAVKVNRSASNIGVVDEGVYLLVGDEIISDNLANAPDWPLIATEWWYGNTGGEQDVNTPWVGENSDFDPLSAQDLNDPEFGFAIRIRSRTTLAAIFAFITYIDLAIYYEDAGDVHILRTGGEADVRSTAYSYEFSEGLKIGGTAGLKMGRRYLTDGISPTLTAAFRTGGSYGRHFSYNPDTGVITDRIKRGVECGGSALVTPYIYNEIPLDADGVDLGGEAVVTTGVVSGTGVRVGGSAHLNPLPVVASGGASMGGAAKVTPYHEVASGGVVVDYKTPQELTLGGEADCRPSWQLVEASGGVSMGGTVKVTPYLEEGTGGASAGGVSTGNHTNNYSYEATGGFTMGGVSSPFEAEIVYEVSGGVEISGEADYKSSAYHFTSDGAAIFVLGGAAVQGSDLGVQQTNAGADFRILELQFDYGEETPEEIDIPAGTVTRCACPEMSFVTEVSHNMVRDNRFAQFLVRNNFTISRILTMKYNAPNDSWQTNLHYRGVSAKNNNLEDWNVVLELRCTSNSGGIELGESIWQFSVQVTVEDLITGEDFDTRILVGLMPDQLCSAGDLSFSVNYDTDLDFVSVNPNAIVYNNILYDHIGLFKSRAWKQSPILSFEVSQSGIDALTPRYDASGFGNNRPLRPV